MQIPITKLARLLALCVVAFAICACAKNLSLNEATAWFERNKVALFKLNEALLAERAVQRVDPALGVQFVPKYMTFDSRISGAYEAMESQCKLLGIRNVQVWRQGSDKSGTLIAIEYTLSSVGIAPASGGYVAIEYSINNPYLEKLRASGVLVEQLKDDGWYIIKSKG